VGFDLASAKPVSGGFDLSSAKPVGQDEEKKPELSSNVAANVGGSVVEPVLQMVTGAVAKPVADVAGLAATAKEIVSPTPGGGDPEGFRQEVQRKLTYDPKTKAGAAVAEYNPLALAGKGVNYVAEKTGEAIRGDKPATSVRGVVGNLVEEGIKQAPQFIGAKGGKLAEEALPAREARAAIERDNPSIKDQVKAKVQKTGYITPPEHGIKKALAGVAGHAKVDKWISAKNTELANREFAKDVGLPEGSDLSPSSLNLKKEEAYQKYRSMESAAGPTLERTPGYVKELRGTLQKIDEKISFDRETYRSLIPAKALVESWLKKQTFNTKLTLNAIKDLRAQAKELYRAGKSEQGRVRMGIATQLEGLFEENLAKKAPNVVNEFRAARTNLAKIHFIEEVTNDVGDVDLAKVGNLSQSKRYKGALTGAQKEAAEFARSFKTVARKKVEEPPSLSVFDGLFVLGALASGHWGIAATEVGGRVAIPYLASKGALQSKAKPAEVGTLRKAAPFTMKSSGIGITEKAQEQNESSDH